MEKRKSPENIDLFNSDDSDTTHKKIKTSPSDVKQDNDPDLYTIVIDEIQFKKIGTKATYSFKIDCVSKSMHFKYPETLEIYINTSNKNINFEKLKTFIDMLGTNKTCCL